MMENKIGEKLSPILEEIEMTLLENSTHTPLPPNFTKEGFRAGIKIFMDVMLDKIWKVQEKLNMSQEERENKATKLGTDIKSLIKEYTGMDSFNM